MFARVVAGDFDPSYSNRRSSSEVFSVGYPIFLWKSKSSNKKCMRLTPLQGAELSYCFFSSVVCSPSFPSFWPTNFAIYKAWNIQKKTFRTFSLFAVYSCWAGAQVLVGLGALRRMAEKVQKAFEDRGFCSLRYGEGNSFSSFSRWRFISLFFSPRHFFLLTCFLFKQMNWTGHFWHIVFAFGTGPISFFRLITDDSRFLGRSSPMVVL